MLFSAFHAMAQARGEGLRPEFLRLIAAQEARRAANVIDIASRRDTGGVQAGPMPQAAITDALPDGVTPLRRQPRLPETAGDGPFPIAEGR